jgi:hypothetical protein
VIHRERIGESSLAPDHNPAPSPATCRIRLVVTALAVILAAAGFSPAAAAQEPNQAGLVVQFDADRVESWCIPFDDDEIGGDDLLARSGLDLVIDATSGLGISVCQIEGQGCTFPAQHCFCQCMGGEGCRYWNYFYRDPGADEWTYSPLGALLRHVQPGAVEAWVWGDGQTPPDTSLTFEAICSPPTPTTPPPTSLPATATTAATATSVAIVTSAAMATTLAVAPSASSTPAPTALPTDRPAASPTAASPAAPDTASSYLFFGLFVLILLLIGGLVWLRRR